MTWGLIFLILWALYRWILTPRSAGGAISPTSRIPAVNVNGNWKKL